MACDECRDLNTHQFRSHDDLVHAVQVAAGETERGVLRRIQAESLSEAEREALHSAHEASELPGSIRYRFECTVCGDRFELAGNIAQGSGGWTREVESAASK